MSTQVVAPGVDLDQDLRQRDPGQAVLDLPLQGGQPFGLLLGLDWADDEAALLDSYIGTQGQRLVEPPDTVVELRLHQQQPLVGAEGEAEQGIAVGPLLLPDMFGHEVGGWVGAAP